MVAKLNIMSEEEVAFSLMKKIYKSVEGDNDPRATKKLIEVINASEWFPGVYVPNLERVGQLLEAEYKYGYGKELISSVGLIRTQTNIYLMKVLKELGRFHYTHSAYEQLHGAEFTGGELFRMEVLFSENYVLKNIRDVSRKYESEAKNILRGIVNR